MGGMNELLKMYMQFMMMKRFFGGMGGQGGEQLGQTPMPQQGAMSVPLMQMLMQGAPQQMPPNIFGG